MKTLDELGISPAPWKATGGYWVEYGDYSVDDMSGAFETFAIPDTEEAPANARLIAAAPMLYEALAAMLHCAELNRPYIDMSHMDIAMDMARKALAKAGGESKEGETK